MPLLGLSNDDLESAEQELLAGLRTDAADAVDSGVVLAASWRLEGAGVLAWSLGLLQEIPPPHTMVDAARLRSLVPPDAAAFESFVVNAEARPPEALFSTTHEWAMRFFAAEIQPPSEVRSRIIERARAMRWLTEPDKYELSALSIFRD
jgi:hypothetical protein